MPFDTSCSDWTIPFILISLCVICLSKTKTCRSCHAQYIYLHPSLYFPLSSRLILTDPSVYSILDVQLVLKQHTQNECSSVTIMKHNSIKNKPKGQIFSLVILTYWSFWFTICYSSVTIMWNFEFIDYIQEKIIDHILPLYLFSVLEINECIRYLCYQVLYIFLLK
jgi:hypothetical protein